MHRMKDGKRKEKKHSHGNGHHNGNGHNGNGYHNSTGHAEEGYVQSSIYCLPECIGKIGVVLSAYNKEHGDHAISMREEGQSPEGMKKVVFRYPTGNPQLVMGFLGKVLSSLDEYGRTIKKDARGSYT